jgi:predicted NBD/HSP70 family sugar kinase
MSAMQLLHSEHASRKVNGQAVLQAIVGANAPVSRAELARELGLSKQTLSEIMGLLEKANWIRSVGTKQGALGRAAVSYELNPNVGYVVGVVFEGERYAIGLADMRGSLRIKKEGVLSAKAIADGAALAESLINLVQGLADNTGLPTNLIRQMVIGVPGIVDPGDGHVHHSPNLPALQRVDLRKLLAQKFLCGVQLDNDMNLHAYGEFRFGCSQKTQSSVFVGLGSGIGMGIMLGNQVWRGAKGGAGEIGYMPVDHQALTGEARERGALELSLAENKPSGALDADQELDRVARDCAFAIACIVPVLDPEMIVLGGARGDDARLHARLSHWLDLYSSEKIAVRRSALGADAGLLGAVALGIQVSQDQLFLMA